jgi:hypothetical protein
MPQQASGTPKKKDTNPKGSVFFGRRICYTDFY